MSRRAARELALKSLFSLDFQPDASLGQLFAVLQDEDKPQEMDVEYAKTLLEGVAGCEKEIDALLEGVSKAWSVSRMPGIDRNLLRLAVYEMFYAEPKIPSAVAINEAVSLAKIYGTDESGAFINGVLGKLVKTHDE